MYHMCLNQLLRSFRWWLRKSIYDYLYIFTIRSLKHYTMNRYPLLFFCINFIFVLYPLQFHVPSVAPSWFIFHNNFLFLVSKYLTIPSSFSFSHHMNYAWLSHSAELPFAVTLPILSIWSYVNRVSNEAFLAQNMVNRTRVLSRRYTSSYTCTDVILLTLSLLMVIILLLLIFFFFSFLCNRNWVRWDFVVYLRDDHIRVLFGTDSTRVRWWRQTWNKSLAFGRW